MKCIACIILMIPTLIEIPFAPHVVFWNVGQGQFSTVLTKNHCYHFDFGGEFFPSKVLDICKKRNNILILSHEDKDHFNFLKPLARNFEDLCSLHTTFDPRIPRVESCSTPSKNLQNLYKKSIFKSKNANSRVYVFNETYLFTGDSTKQSEKLWASQISSTIRYWIVPHHGSNSSTSEQLLRYIPINSIGIVSARYEKYGHPHREVLKRLKAKKIPVLKTQDWGHIRVQSNEL